VVWVRDGLQRFYLSFNGIIIFLQKTKYLSKSYILKIQIYLDFQLDLFNMVEGSISSLSCLCLHLFQAG